MSFFLSALRIIRFAFQNFFRNFWLSVITMSVFVLTLITVNALIFINVLGSATVQSVQEKVEVSIYFEPDTSDDIVKSAQGYLLGLSQVRNVTFVSAEDALVAFKEHHQNDAVILDSLEEIDGNPFGSALVISAWSPDDFTFILEAIETPEYQRYIKKKDFTDYEAVISKIQNLSDRIRIGGLVLAGFFILIAILIIFNTIRVATYVHRDEIGIMKLVGANDWFVRGPFLLEAIMYSAASTAIMVGIVFLSMRWLEPWVSTYFGGIDFSAQQFFLDNALLIFGSQFLVLSVLGLFTTMFAIRRYLRV
ncbi:MAG: permease-like cell division protein FtsX [Candidatus Uhrbacteria bacterium]|nr:permease-like cell division protein FtsX [Candidatus Uhrbacteria bacterium]